MSRTVKVYIAQQAIQDAGKSKCYLNATPSHHRNAATLVIHDGSHERVFTGSEVKAILREVLTYQATVGIDDGCSGSIATSIVEEAEVLEAFATHGIVLDPTPERP